MNYKEEKEKLIKENTFWKPEVRLYEVEILNEPKIVAKEFNGIKTEEIWLPINTEMNQYIWTMGRGTTLNSCFGQLVVLGEHFGKLKGLKVQVIVTKDNDKRKYIIREAQKLIKQQAELKELEKVEEVAI